MDNILYRSLMYDFYNEMLTEKQREVYELYNHNDMSLSEVSDHFSITPQGVSDILKRTEKALNNYESKLKFVDNYIRQQKEIEDINVILNQFEGSVSIELIKEIKDKLCHLI